MRDRSKARIPAYFDLGFSDSEPEVPQEKDVSVYDQYDRDKAFSPGLGVVAVAILLLLMILGYSIALGPGMMEREIPGLGERLAESEEAAPAEGVPEVAEVVLAADGDSIMSSMVVQLLLILFGGALLIIVVASLLHFLRQRSSRLFWEVACWALVVIGIMVRQMVADNSPALGMGELIASAVVGLVILPALMRHLNKISSRPGLQHVAVPFSLGFFVDLAQVLAANYVPLPWAMG